MDPMRSAVWSTSSPARRNARRSGCAGAFGNFGTNQQRADLSYAASRWSEQLTFSRDFSTGFIPNRDYRNLSLASRTSLTLRVGNHGDHPCQQRPAFRRRAVLRELQFVGTHPDVVRLRPAVSGQKDRCGLRIPAAHRPLRPLSRSAAGIHKSPCRRKLPGFAFAAAKTWAELKLFYGAEMYRDSIVSNNLGAHGRARTAPYVALDVRALAPLQLLRRAAR